MGSYTAALNHYLGTELEYSNDLPYEIISMKVNSSWSYKEFHNSHTRVVDQLATAMRANPHMKVHVASGYHDGATPYFASQHSMRTSPFRMSCAPTSPWPTTRPAT